MVEKVKNQNEISVKLIKITQQEHHAKIKKQKFRRNCKRREEIKSIITEKITKRPVEARVEVGA